MRLTRALTTLMLAAVAGLSLAACGGSDSPEVANLGNAAATTNEEGETTEAATDPEEAMLAFTECMRENGVDVPDPEFSEDGEGGPRIQMGPGGDFDPNDPDFQAAQEKCRSHLEGIQGRFDPENQEAFQDAALEFAQCMRDQGVDFPDPQFQEGPGGGGGMLFGGEGIDPNDPDFQAAQEECQQVFEDLGIGPPGGGPPPGGGEEDGS